MNLFIEKIEGIFLEFSSDTAQILSKNSMRDFILETYSLVEKSYEYLNMTLFVPTLYLEHVQKIKNEHGLWKDLSIVENSEETHEVKIVWKDPKHDQSYKVIYDYEQPILIWMQNFDLFLKNIKNDLNASFSPLS